MAARTESQIEASYDNSYLELCGERQAYVYGYQAAEVRIEKLLGALTWIEAHALIAHRENIHSIALGALEADK